MNHRIEQILDTIEELREGLLALSDDIWLSINHNDPDELEKGTEFKRQYNEAVLGFSKSSEQISQLIQNYTNTDLDAEVITASSTDHAENDRIIRALDQNTPYFLHFETDFSYKRPIGFVLDGRGTENVRTWKQMYLITCKQLANRFPQGFAELPTHADFITSRGNNDFAFDQDSLRLPHKIIDGVYTETNYSANDIIKRIRRLLTHFGLDPIRNFTIYLREDRNAEVA